MKQDTQLIVKEAMTGASKGALVAAASSIVGGVAMVTTPAITILGIGIGTSIAVALPVVAAVAVGGAVVGGSVAAIQRHRKNKKIHKQFENLHGKK
jgi:predicted RND superfamily exporter protein